MVFEIEKWVVKVKGVWTIIELVGVCDVKIPGNGGYRMGGGNIWLMWGHHLFTSE